MCLQQGVEPIYHATLADEEALDLREAEGPHLRRADNRHYLRDAARGRRFLGQVAAGTAIPMVEQNLKHALALAQCAVVLNRGSKLYDRDPVELRDEQKLLELL